MRRLILFLLFSLSSATVATSNRENDNAIDPSDFVSVNGLRFKDSKGTHYVTGMNYWACMNLAADESVGGNYSRLTTELDQMAAKGVNHLRIMASSEGAPTPQPFRMNPPLMQEPGNYNEVVFAGLDRCLDEMSKRGMRATMTLNDEWQWSGGFAQYVSWALNNTTIPYPPSWNISAPPQRSPPGTGWGDYTVMERGAASYSDFQSFSNLMYSTPKAEEWFKNHIKAVVNRKNSVNGRIYKEDATIMTWQLANEPQAEAPLGTEGEYGFYLTPNPDDLLFTWVDRISTYIRGLAPKQLINVGLESKQGKYYFQHAHNFTTVDYATTHCWVQNWGLYDMNDPSEANLQQAQKFAKAFIHNSSQWAAEIGKPVLLEEFGMARDNWQNKDKEYPYLSNATTTHKDAYFEVRWIAQCNHGNLLICTDDYRSCNGRVQG